MLYLLSVFARYIATWVRFPPRGNKNYLAFRRPLNPRETMTEHQLLLLLSNTRSLCCSEPVLNNRSCEKSLNMSIKGICIEIVYTRYESAIEGMSLSFPQKQYQEIETLYNNHYRLLHGHTVCSGLTAHLSIERPHTAFRKPHTK